MNGNVGLSIHLGGVKLGGRCGNGGIPQNNLVRYPACDFDAEGRSLVGGAVAYFLLAADVGHDFESPIGLRDDGRVFNSVCRALGRVDLEVPLSR